MLLFYIWQNIYLNESRIFFYR